MGVPKRRIPAQDPGAKGGLAGRMVGTGRMINSQRPVLVVTNDDGIEAPGLAALSEAAKEFGRVVIVAPREPSSGCSHQATTHGPIEIRCLGSDRFAVGGTPVDCVRLAIDQLVPDAVWILSGINAGGNLGTDVFHSGTVAAVREAAIHGRRGIAVSQYLARGRPVDWATASSWAARALGQIMRMGWEPGSFWNVNLPHPPPGVPDPKLTICALDPSPLPLAYRRDADSVFYEGDYQSRARRPGGDVAVCFGGDIAITRLTLVGPSD